jgi:F1F0 ATPase subunit 2
VTDPLLLAALGLAAGLALGAGHFGGLWWTVRRATSARRPGRLLALSALGRGAALAAGLVALAKIGPWTLLAGLAGVLIARLVATRTAVAGVAQSPRGRAGRPAAHAREGGGS